MDAKPITEKERLAMIDEMAVKFGTAKTPEERNVIWNATKLLKRGYERALSEFK